MKRVHESLMRRADDEQCQTLFITPPKNQNKKKTNKNKKTHTNISGIFQCEIRHKDATKEIVLALTSSCRRACTGNEKS